ncbi:AMP-dependent synthetase/ligase [Streptomyces sp. CRN 30]|uniref:AMP-dependent synthetase/ligase n=1 Tax=Streptomyces sp. CRN 30 TaxID=3075613 RepID=UPI002A82FFEA|nr:AMP-dependent synthetase/ligase [Streptomyces sp. CRN 30]
MTPAPRTDGGATAETTLPRLLERNARDHPDLPALSWREPDSDGWATLSWADVQEHTTRLAAGYAALGVGSGDHVLLMASDRPEHWLSDLALVRLGAVPVSVYGTSAPPQIAHIARNCRAAVAVVEGGAQAEVWEPLLHDGDTPLARLVVMEPGEEGDHLPYAALGREPVPDEFGKALDGARPDDPLTVVYTSGTTGEPKGVVLSHRQVLANARALDAVVELPPHVEHIAYLPFAHIAERMLGIYLPCHRASHVHLCADPTAVAAAVREIRPRQFFGVPRIWEKLAAAVRAGLALLPEERRRAVEEAAEVAREHVACRERGEQPPAELETAYEAARERVLLPLLRAGGLDRVTWAASASAPMPLDVVRFWAGFGIVVMDAWGLTETTGVATTNSPRTGFRLGSVGRPVESVEVRTAEDGEIEVRGESVFTGYLRPDGSVRSALDEDGWLRTGDIGRIDDDGYVWVTDRKKEMIITSTGKNVSPALVENALKEHPLIGQALVHGDGRSYLVALLVLDAETAPAWAAANGVDAGHDPAELAAHPAVLREVDRAVAAANSRLNRTEQVKRHRLLAEEWGPATGELTPSLKMRRRVIRDRYATELTGLYDG